MTDQHRATPEQWEVVEICREEGKIPWPTATALLELRARIEALEAAQLNQAESSRFCTDGITLAKLATGALPAAQALDRDDPTPDDVIVDEGEQFHAVTARTNGWRTLDIETTCGTEAAADAAQQILRAPITVEGTFEHGGETYRFKAKPERESAMTELRAASAEVRPAELVERVAKGIAAADDEGLTNMTWNHHARAAIREVAAWLRDNNRADLAGWLEQEANQ